MRAAGISLLTRQTVSLREADSPAKIGFVVWLVGLPIQIRWISTTRGAQFMPIAPYLVRVFTFKFHQRL